MKINNIYDKCFNWYRHNIHFAVLKPRIKKCDFARHYAFNKSPMWVIKMCCHNDCNYYDISFYSIYTIAWKTFKYFSLQNQFSWLILTKLGTKHLGWREFKFCSNAWWAISFPGEDNGEKHWINLNIILSRTSAPYFTILAQNMGERNSKGHDLLQGDTIATQQKYF